MSQCGGGGICVCVCVCVCVSIPACDTEIIYHCVYYFTRGPVCVRLGERVCVDGGGHVLRWAGQKDS